MLDALELERVARQLCLPGFGLEQQRRLNEARVLVVGAGGLGSPALLSLAAAGVGHIRLVDDDRVDISNLHRQVLFGVEDAGRQKAACAAEKLRAIQPGIDVEAVNRRLVARNAVSLIEGIDMIFDGSDNFATKYLCADLAEITGIPLVWGSVLQFSGQMAVFDSTTGLRDLFPEVPARGLNCADAGVLGSVTAVIANLMATESIKLIAGIGDVTPGVVTAYDAATATFRRFVVRADPDRPRVTGLAKVSLPEVYVLVDVREAAENEAAPGGAFFGGEIIVLPQSMWDDEAAVLDALRSISLPDVVVACASGMRSAAFIERFADRVTALRFHGLSGGIRELS